MKNLLITLVIALVVIGAGLLAMSHRMDYLNNQRNTEAAEQSKAEAESARKIEQLQAERDTTVRNFETLKAECAKGLVAYNNLTAFNRRNLAAPNCDLVAE